jgi:hypothetical protein
VTLVALGGGQPVQLQPLEDAPHARGADRDVVVALEVHRDLGRAEVVVLAQVDDYASYEVSIRYTGRRTGPRREDDQRFRWSDVVWWACQDLNLGPHPYQGSAQGLFPQDCIGGLGERQAAGDRWRPLRTARIRWRVDQTWTKPVPVGSTRPVDVSTRAYSTGDDSVLRQGTSL